MTALIAPHRFSDLSSHCPSQGVDAMDTGVSSEEVVNAYHERTKHHFHRYAASLGYMDWATQPDPFRRYSGADLVRLPLLRSHRPLPYGHIYVHGRIAPEPLSLQSISLLFRYALSLTAWKRFHDTTWSLRSNPSSGNLHPTEGYALLPALEHFGGAPAVYHYLPKEHALERRAHLDARAWNELCTAIPDGSFLVGLSSIHWREAWKYGERAFRYCQHDTGHALATLRISAAVLGWQLVLLDGISHSAISDLLGLDRGEEQERAEREEPELLALVVPTREPIDRSSIDESAVVKLSAAVWHGEANTLSANHVIDWPVIHEVARATRRSAGLPTAEAFSGFPAEEQLFAAPIREGLLTADRAILGRRSAVAMDGSTSLTREVFFQMLARLIPTRDRRSMPWDAIPWRPRIHLGLFVHRVENLPPGLYVLVRDPAKTTALKELMHPQFRWERLSGCPPGLPLYLLREADVRALAATVSCHQHIAGDGVFSLGMIADYRDSLSVYGAAFYRNLFWEAGMVGQVLYLEAEEAGIRATGIGCYFDDPVHEVFGFSSPKWQSFYHFTVGGAVEDTRLMSLPAYPFEGEG